jgi:type 1 glutamine amidotransferase
MTRRVVILYAGLCFSALHGQELTSDQKQQVDQAVPGKAPAKPVRPRRLLVSNLSMRDGRPVRGSSFASIPSANYAFEQIGKRTGAYAAVFSNDIEMFRPDKIKQFYAICFLNTLGVLFDDPELRQSLLAFIAEGKGFVGIHDALATFVQYPKYGQWPAFGQMLGATENGGHPWNGEMMTIKIDDPASPVNAMFHGQEFQIADQAFQFQELLLRDHLHVLLSIDAVKTAPSARGHLLPVRAQDKDFPVSWLRSYGKGRVFYCSLGHGAAIYSNRLLLEHFLAGTQYALGDLQADSTPSAGAK